MPRAVARSAEIGAGARAGVAGAGDRRLRQRLPGRPSPCCARPASWPRCVASPASRSSADVLNRWAREAAEVSGDDATVAVIWIETSGRVTSMTAMRGIADTDVVRLAASHQQLQIGRLLGRRHAGPGVRGRAARCRPASWRSSGTGPIRPARGSSTASAGCSRSAHPAAPSCGRSTSPAPTIGRASAM